MAIQHGTITFFNPKTSFGFVQINGEGKTVFFHQNQRCRVAQTGPTQDDIAFKSTYHVPKVGDELVLDVVPNEKGGKAVSWAFKRELDEAQCPPKSATKSAQVTAPRSTTLPAPKVDSPLAFDEMLKVLDFRFLHAVLDAMEKEELTLLQLQDFVRNTPKGKRGEALWEEFHKRKTHSRDKKYGVASFIKQVLVEAGFLIEP